MATQTNPFSQGLAAWAQSLDPADMARGQAMQAGIRKASLEEQILADRIRNRGLLSTNSSADPLAVAAALSNESFTPESLVNANLKGKSAATLLDPYASLAQRGRAAAARGDALTESLVNTMEGRRPAPKVETINDSAGNVYAFTPDPDSPLGARPELMLPAAPERTQTQSLPPGGSLMERDPKTGEWNTVMSRPPAPRPVTPTQVAAARAQADRVQLGPNYQGPANHLGKMLGYVDELGQPIQGKARLNPAEEGSVVRRALEIHGTGSRTMAASLSQSLAEHGINVGNLVEKEFEGVSAGWNVFNPDLDVEAQGRRPGQNFAIPLPDFGGRFLASPDADFYNPDWRPTEYGKAKDQLRLSPGDVGYRPDLRRSDLRKVTDVKVVPLTTVSRLTSIGDDLATAVGTVHGAKPYNPSNPITPGEFYYKTLPSGKELYGVAAENANGEVELVWDSAQ